MKKILVTQIRSGAGRAERFVLTLRALGLGRIGKSKQFVASAALLGMLEKVACVIRVSEVK